MDGLTAHLPPDVKRHKFSGADVQAMIAAGVLREGDHHVELIGGELVEMSPQGPLHWKHTHRIVAWLARNLPASLTVASNGPLRLSEFDEPEPELFVFPDAMDVNDVRGRDALLVVEVAHSSLKFDLAVKAPLYASHGIGAYWVIDIENQCTLVHRRGQEAAYGAPQTVAFDQPLATPGGVTLVLASILSPPKA